MKSLNLHFLFTFTFFCFSFGSYQARSFSPVIIGSYENAKEFGVIIEDANFWIGPPDEKASMPLLKISAGKTVELKGKHKDFLKIQYRDLLGYVESKMVQKIEKEEIRSESLENVPLTEEPPVKKAKLASKPLIESNKYTITKETSLRKAPDSKARVLVRLKVGSKLQVLDSSGKWWWKVNYKGREGWAKRALLKNE